MNNYVLSADADRDLDDIWESTAQDNIDAADRWIGKLLDAFEAIGRTPGIGHKREDLSIVLPDRRLPIIYRTIRPTVEIVAITGCA